MPKRIIVCISGSGSNLQAIIDAVAAKKINAEIILVVSNRKAAYGLTRAQQAGIPTHYEPLKPFLDRGQTRADYDAHLAEQLAPYNADLIVLAGWMHIFSSAFINHFAGKVINLHPALPDAFPGLHAIERTYEAYQNGQVSHGGCMIHYVIPEVDAGEVIKQAIVPISPDDTLETFEENMHRAEHKLFVEALELLCNH
jgi:formyltetrahydrofolate-dependent phosphoribosylglycinamide formyltransferase